MIKIAFKINATVARTTSLLFDVRTKTLKMKPTRYITNGRKIPTAISAAGGIPSPGN